MGWRIGVDIGGTTTDVAVLDEEIGRANIARVPTTPRDFGAAAIDGIGAAMRDRGMDPASVSLTSPANIAGIYRRKVKRLAEALAIPRDCDEAADAIRGPIERIALTPGERRGQMHATLWGDLGTILEWAGADRGRKSNGSPPRGMSVSAIVGTEFELHEKTRSPPDSVKTLLHAVDQRHKPTGPK